MNAPAPPAQSVKAAATMAISFLGSGFLAGAGAATGAAACLLATGAAACLVSAMSIPATVAALPRDTHSCDQRRAWMTDYSGPHPRPIGRIRRAFGGAS